MGDYVVPLPPPNVRLQSRYSTSGDSTTLHDQWLWPAQALQATPSGKLGMAWGTENHIRSRAVDWVVRISIALQLPQLIIATASAYLHRFYMRKPIQKYPIKAMSATALFLATKVEEVPRKLEYVVREYVKVDDAGHERIGPIPEDSNDFRSLKQQILYFEDILLRTLCFDLAVDHPYLPLVQGVKTIHIQHTRAHAPDSVLSVELADRSKAKSLAQAAWGFVNDSLLTPLCVITTPEVIAASAFLLAVAHRLSERPPPDLDQTHAGLLGTGGLDLDRFLELPLVKENSEHEVVIEPWWKTFNVASLQQVHEVVNVMLDQYSTSVSLYIRDRASKVRLSLLSLNKGRVGTYDSALNERSDCATDRIVNRSTNPEGSDWATDEIAVRSTNPEGSDCATDGVPIRSTTPSSEPPIRPRSPSIGSPAPRSTEIGDENQRSLNESPKKRCRKSSLSMDTTSYCKHLKTAHPDDEGNLEGGCLPEPPRTKSPTKNESPEQGEVTLSPQMASETVQNDPKAREPSVGTSSLSDMEDGEVD